jgi:hypothetical protein
MCTRILMVTFLCIAIEWLRHKFNEVFDKIQFVKTKANGKSLLSTGGRVLSADKLIYDRALEKVSHPFFPFPTFHIDINFS